MVLDVFVLVEQTTEIQSELMKEDGDLGSITPTTGDNPPIVRISNCHIKVDTLL
jgi:hypothetical protein